jgi:hypothetical protein
MLYPERTVEVERLAELADNADCEASSYPLRLAIEPISQRSRLVTVFSRSNLIALPHTIAMMIGGHERVG